MLRWLLSIIFLVIICTNSWALSTSPLGMSIDYDTLLGAGSDVDIEIDLEAFDDVDNVVITVKLTDPKGTATIDQSIVSIGKMDSSDQNTNTCTIEPPLMFDGRINILASGEIYGYQVSCVEEILLDSKADGMHLVGIRERENNPYIYPVPLNDYNPEPLTVITVPATIHDVNDDTIAIPEPNLDDLFVIGEPRGELDEDTLGIFNVQLTFEGQLEWTSYFDDEQLRPFCNIRIHIYNYDTGWISRQHWSGYADENGEYSIQTEAGGDILAFRLDDENDPIAHFRVEIEFRDQENNRITGEEDVPIDLIIGYGCYQPGFNTTRNIGYLVNRDARPDLLELSSMWTALWDAKNFAYSINQFQRTVRVKHVMNDETYTNHPRANGYYNRVTYPDRINVKVGETNSDRTLLHEYGHLYQHWHFEDWPWDDYDSDYYRHLPSNEWTAMLEGFADFYFCLATLYSEYNTSAYYYGHDLGEDNRDWVPEDGPEVIHSVVNLWWDLVDLDNDLFLEPPEPPPSCGDGKDDYNGFSDRINMGYEYFFEVLDYLSDLDEGHDFWDHPLEEMEAYLISDFQYTGDADYYIQQVFEMNGMDWDPLDHDPSFTDIGLVYAPTTWLWRQLINTTFYVNYSPQQVWQDYEYTWHYRVPDADWIEFGVNYHRASLNNIEMLYSHLDIKCKVESQLTQDYGETTHRIVRIFPPLYHPENVTLDYGVENHVRISWDMVHTSDDLAGYLVTRNTGNGEDEISDFLDSDVLQYVDLNYYLCGNGDDPGAIRGDYRVYSFEIDSLGCPAYPDEEPDCVSGWISTEPHVYGGLPKRTVTKIEPIPNDYEFLKMYPNPFNATINVPIALPEDNKVNIAIFNIKGQKIITLADNEFQAGYHNLSWNSNSKEGFASSGIYFVVMKSSEFMDTQKILLIK
ncbi:MAG: T9SS type A sorting domain-containing protein [Candidatus Electryonea clarkiae]|nr:T9SS type A sorting domain-containing protein [Candidatus Electryonea clarkiae]MDP8287768.1 T9SS type A sorting domain-containing protein [Candidatus Electryonea clarkiae]